MGNVGYFHYTVRWINQRFNARSIDIAVESARRQQHMADLAAWQLQPGDARLLMPEMPTSILTDSWI